MKILLAVDGSAYTKHMLTYVAGHPEWFGSNHQYTVVHAVPKVSPHAASSLSREMLDEYYHDEAEKVFEPIRAFFEQHGLQAEFVGITGHVAEVISQKADSGGFDLLMMGSHGQGSVLNMVMGSVATKVLAGCKLPVLLVR